MSKEKCVEIIEGIYEDGEDVSLPHREGAQPIIMLGSKEGYQMQAAYEPVVYDSAEGVFVALNAYYEKTEEDSLWSLQIDLEHVS